MDKDTDIDVNTTLQVIATGASPTGTNAGLPPSTPGLPPSSPRAPSPGIPSGTPRAPPSPSGSRAAKAERKAHRAHRKKKKRKQGSLTTKLLGGSQEYIRQPRGDEEELLRSVDLGDIPTVRRLLRYNPHINVNCTDILGRTPLRLAVENEQLEIVELLLDKTEPRHLYESVLLAITLDHDDISMLILRHPLYERMEAGGDIFQFHHAEESLFSAETTPLILAAQRNRYEIVSILLKKGQRIEAPHNQSCMCVPCKTRVALDELRFARSRLNAYKGLASEAYICLSSDDPILTAFELRRTLDKTASKEKHYREEYEELEKKLSAFTVRLINNVRGNEELDVILTEGSDGQEDMGKGGHRSLARLKLAIKYDEKGFVAHPSVQKKLATIWYGMFQTYTLKLPQRMRWLASVMLAVSLPFITVAYWIYPHPVVLDFLRNPYVKFVGQTASFFVFLTLIVAFSFTMQPTESSVSTLKEILENSIRPEDNFSIEALRSNSSLGLDPMRLVVRERQPSATLIIIIIFIAGLIWQECKQLYSSGPRDYFTDIFNLIDFFSLQMYVVSFTLRVLTYDKTSVAVDFFKQRGSLEALYRNQKDARTHLYWVIADRVYWDSWDPINICEGVFAIANVLSFTRLLYLLAANEQLGPLQVSLRRMMVDISRFFVLFLVVFCAFLVGLNNLYWYYHPDVRQLIEGGPLTFETNAESAFGTFEQTLTTVFWAIFGMGDADVVELDDAYSSDVTRRIGYIVYGAYNMSVVIVLLNMLIAMMTRSFDSIQNDESIEWKFARAQLYMDIMTDDSFLPVPFNIVPSPITVYRFCKWLAKVCRSCCRKTKSAHHRVKSIKSHSKSRNPGDSATDQVAFTNPAFTDDNGVDAEPNQMLDANGNAKIEETKTEEGKPHYNLKRRSDILPVLTYETVIKRIVKRYIFESQKVETSQLEGDMEELKQDMSSFKYEVINALSNQKLALQDSMNMVSAKLDIYSALQGASMEQIEKTNAKLSKLASHPNPDDTIEPKRHTSSRRRHGVFTAPDNLSHLANIASRQNTFPRVKPRKYAGKGQSYPVNVVVSGAKDDDAQTHSDDTIDEELIIPDLVVYGDTPGKMQPFSSPKPGLPHGTDFDPDFHLDRPGARRDSLGADLHSQRGSIFSDTSAESDSELTHRTDAGISSSEESTTIRSSTYTCANCKGKTNLHKRPYVAAYTRQELQRFIDLLDNEPVEGIQGPPTISKATSSRQALRHEEARRAVEEAMMRSRNPNTLSVPSHLVDISETASPYCSSGGESNLDESEEEYTSHL